MNEAILALKKVAQVRTWRGSSNFYLWVRIVSTILFVLIWEYFGKFIDPVILARPSVIMVTFWEMVLSGELFWQLLISLQSFGAGFGLAVGFGVLTGLLLGRYRFLDAMFQHYINALYPTPMVALIPLIILWFGLDFQAKVVMVFLVSYFPIVYNTTAGVQNLSKHYLDVAKAYGANEKTIFTEVTIPAALPFIMAGIRLGIGRGLTGMVVAEMFTAISGMGALILITSNTLATPKLFVAIITLAILGVILLGLGLLLERKLAPWKESEKAF